MQPPLGRQAQIWGLAAVAAVLALLWMLGQVILPFVLGATLAYLLDPLADRLERLGLSRLLATVTISVVALLVLGLALVLVVPLLMQQAGALFAAAPGLLQSLGQTLTEALPQGLPMFPDLEQALAEGMAATGQLIQSRGAEVLNRVLVSALSLLDIVLLVVVVPVVAFYMLLDWDRMIAGIDALLPRAQAPVVRRLAADIDRTIAAFIRGMGTVCVIMAIYYAVALSLAGLQFGLVVGALAGLVTFIPYVGAILGGALALGLGLVQFWGDWLALALVAAVFALGQFVEGNILTPRLVGTSVGLHPVWLIFALAAFGALFGFVGLLVAVPVAAAVGVVVRHLLGVYRDSALYRGDPQ